MPEWIYKPSDVLTHQLNVSYLITSTDASFGTNVDLDFLFQQVLIRESVDWTLSDHFKFRAGTDTELLISEIDAYGERWTTEGGRATQRRRSTRRHRNQPEKLRAFPRNMDGATGEVRDLFVCTRATGGLSGCN